MSLVNLIKSLPKAELHLHIEGTLEPSLMFEIAKRNKITLPYDSIESLHKAYDFHNLQSFLDIYYLGAKVLLFEDDFYSLAMAYFAKCASENIVHAEIFFDPQAHTSRGVAFGVVVDGLHRACRDAFARFGITSALIMCFLRHLDEASAFKTLEAASPYREKIIGVGLDSSELGNPPSKFARVFAKAREMGYKVVAHAGEEGDSSYIDEALELLKVSRIDHGVRCIEDLAVLQKLKKLQIPLTICPLSNLRLKVVKDLAAHNLLKLLNMGLKVTINSDDPAYFGGYLNDNYIAIIKALNLDLEALKCLVVNGFEASYLSEDKKAKWVQKVENIIALAP